MDTRDFYANPTQICMIRKVHTLLYDFLVMNPFLPENMPVSYTHLTLPTTPYV